MNISKEKLLLLGIAFLEIVTLTLMKTDTHVIIILLLYTILGYGLRFLIKKKGLRRGITHELLGMVCSSLIAILYFDEKISLPKIFGLLLAMGSLYLLNSD